MKLIHLSDLHLGKRLNGFSMIEDQAYILNKICKIIADEKPDGVLIAGDVYDKAVPSAEAVALFDDFLSQLGTMDLRVFVISGNHDSPERIAFGGRLMARGGIHLSPVYDGMVEPIFMEDEYGKAAFWLLPFIKPIHVRRAFPDETIESYSDALAAAIAHMDVDTTIRNVLITHQFVMGAEPCESEELSIGGTENVNGSIFADFDYVALGHIHGPQKIGRETMRYCGTPLKYSFSEVHHQKSVTVVELGAKGDVTVRSLPLTPMRDLVEIRGTYMELTAKGYYDALDRNAYYHITLTDEEDVPDALTKLRVIYPNLMKLDYDNARTRSSTVIEGEEAVDHRSPLELVMDFYARQNGQEMNDDQRSLCAALIEKIWEGTPCGH